MAILYVLTLPVVILVLMFFSIAPAVGSWFLPRGRTYAWALRSWSRFALFVFGVRIRLHGTPPPHADGNVIFISNHASYIDIPVLSAALNHPIAFVYKQELQKIPIWGYLMKISPHVPINRSEGREAFQTIEETGRAIRGGEMSVVVFPEGTRTSDGRMGEFKRGGFLLATRAGVPIVPIAIHGTHAILPRDSYRVRPGRVDVIVGEPIEVPVGVSRPQEKGILEAVRRQLEELAARAEAL